MISERIASEFESESAYRLLIAKLIANTVFKLNCTHN